MAHFDEARRAALMGDLLAHLTGRPSDLLPFERVREQLKLRHLVDRGVLEVPLDRIVGSVGREREFNRAFLPREEALRERWKQVEGLAEGPQGLPAVELYQVGDAYFVVDGHHRISVARALGSPAIEARVKEFPTPVRLRPDASIEEIVLESGLAAFLDSTGLEPDPPGEFVTTLPGGYERLLEHIAGHRYFRGIEAGREIPWDEAVRSWRDAVYRPMAATIRSSGVLAGFPGHTETDLYLFVMEHLHHLRERYSARTVRREAAVRHFRWLARRSPVAGGLRAWLRRLLPRRLRGER